MKHESSPSPWWRSPIAWSLLGIAASYQIAQALDSPVWRVEDFFKALVMPVCWFLTPYSAPYCLVAHGVFLTFCLWWRETRHPFFYVLIPLSAWSCTAFSMWRAVGHGFFLHDIPSLIWIGFGTNAFLLLLCLWWRRKQHPILYAWLPMALLLASPFGVAFLIP